MVDKQRIKTMKERLGEAVNLIDDDRFLPMYRNRQIHYKELFDYSIELAKTKKSPSRYFASVWGKKNLKKSVEWLQKLLNGVKSKLASIFWKKKAEERENNIALEIKKNTNKLDKLSAMKLSYGLRS